MQAGFHFAGRCRIHKVIADEEVTFAMRRCGGKGCAGACSLSADKRAGGVWKSQRGDAGFCMVLRIALLIDLGVNERYPTGYKSYRTG